jgi:hypothetical protein
MKNFNELTFKQKIKYILLLIYTAFYELYTGDKEIYNQLINNIAKNGFVEF